LARIQVDRAIILRPCFDLCDQFEPIQCFEDEDRVIPIDSDIVIGSPKSLRAGLVFDHPQDKRAITAHRGIALLSGPFEIDRPPSVRMRRLKEIDPTAGLAVRQIGVGSSSRKVCQPIDQPCGMRSGWGRP